METIYDMYDTNLSSCVNRTEEISIQSHSLLAFHMVATGLNSTMNTTEQHTTEARLAFGMQ